MNNKAEIYYARVDEFWTKEEKYEFLENAQNFSNIEWKLINPNSKYTWLTDDLEEDFDSFISLGDKKTKLGSFEKAKTIFKLYGRGIGTCRDTWAYNFNQTKLANNIQNFLITYHQDLSRYQQSNCVVNIDDFVTKDETLISWSSTLKNHFQKKIIIKYNADHVRNSLYRPFTKSFLYFDKYLNQERGNFSSIFPTAEIEQENLVICVSGVGSSKPFHSLIVSCIPCLDMLEKTQCFPYYIYDEDGSNRRENITDYCLQQFREYYQDETITKWEIFYYVYAILHPSEYRRKYAANLKRELPRIPFLSPLTLLEKGGNNNDQTPPLLRGVGGDQNHFQKISQLGEKLAQIHVNYEQQPEYKLKIIENPSPLNPPFVRGVGWILRVEKMKLSKDKTEIIYNEYLTLTGIPPEVWEYKLGNKSALDWIIDQYQIKTDKRSGIINDPNRLEDEMYIIRLIKKIITVSLETVKLVSELNYYSL
jgi:predicted helicase